MSSTSLVAPAVDAAALLRATLERRQFDSRQPLDALPPTAAPRNVMFHELREVAIRDPADVQRAIVELLGGLHAADVDLLFWIHSDEHGIRLRFGIAQRQSEPDSKPQLSGFLRRGLEGHLLGSKFDAIAIDDPGRSLRTLLHAHKSCGTILGLPGGRDGDGPPLTLDGALEAIVGMPIDVIAICSPAGHRELDIAESNLALISGQAHLLAKQSIGSSDSHSFTEAVSTGFSVATSSSRTVNWSTSVQKGTSDVVRGPGEEAVGTTAGSILGAVLGGLAGFLTVGPMGAAYGASIGGSGGAQIGGAFARVKHPQRTQTESRTDQQGESVGTSETRTQSGGRTDTTGLQVSRQITLETVNRQAGLLEDVAERHLERLRVGRSIGMWRTAVHVAAADNAALQAAAQLLLGALRGDGTHLESLRLVPYSDATAKTAIDAVSVGSAPAIEAPPHPLIPGAEQPQTLLTSQELARWIGIPSHDLPGTPAREVVHFGRGAHALVDQSRDASVLQLGPLVYGGRISNDQTVGISLNELCGHAFVAGTTGAGKTTTIRQLLRGLAGRNVPFLVLEPAKSEYLDLFEELREAGCNPIRLEMTPSGQDPDVLPLRFNPFAAPAGLPLGRHVEALKILLRSCFEMQESLPQLLETVLFDVYADLGWTDLVRAITPEERASRRFPTFADFTAAVPSRRPAAWSRIERAVAAFRYEDRVERNLVAALTVRIQSFLRGLKGSVFVGGDADFSELLRRPCFVNVSDVNEPDIRRFLLGSLFLRLQAEREAVARREPRSTGLRHLVVLEEAHHFLRKPIGEGSGSELVRHSNLLLADAFAEFRAYGQAILVADQAPGELDLAVLRNTNIKIVHRLYEEDDVIAMGAAIGLGDDRRGELRRLQPGECVVFTPSLQHPVVCQVTKE